MKTRLQIAEKWSALAVAMIVCALAGQARAQTTVDLQLVLAVDTSGSVNQTRFELQRRGYAEAFRHPRVLDAIRSGSTGSIAVTMVQWTGPQLQVHVLPWTLLKDRATTEAFAAAVEDTPRQLFSGGTSISGAIDYSMLLFPGAGFKGLKRVIDVSGDGSNNRGRSVTEARDDAVRAGVVINGLPILALEPYLDRYYYQQVIGGPGAFMIPAETYEAFADAVLRKLILEIASQQQPARSFTVLAHSYRNWRDDILGTVGVLGASGLRAAVGPPSMRAAPPFGMAP
jgi:hypothetical protein